MWRHPSYTIYNNQSEDANGGEEQPTFHHLCSKLQHHHFSVPVSNDNIDLTIQQLHQSRNRSDDRDGKNNDSYLDNPDTRHSGGSRE